MRALAITKLMKCNHSIDTGPGAESPLHRTESVDYVIIIAGEVRAPFRLDHLRLMDS